MKQQIHVFYSGQVQGVGFRYTARETAQRFGITGWVRNLRDGRVELVAEGEESHLLAFLEEMRDGSLGNYIRDAQVTWSDSTEGFNRFEVLPTA